MNSVLKFLFLLAGFYLLQLLWLYTDKSTFLAVVIVIFAIVWPYLLYIRKRNSHKYDNLAQSFGLMYSKDASYAPDLNKEREFARKYFSLGPISISYIQSFSDLILGEINGKKVEFVNISLREKPSLFFPVQKNIQARFTTRLKIDGREKYICQAREAISTKPYGDQYAPISIIENIFKELKETGTSKTFNESLGSSLFQGGKFIAVSYLSFYEGTLDVPSSALREFEKNLRRSPRAKSRKRKWITFWIVVITLFGTLIYLSSDAAPKGYSLEDLLGM